MSHFKIWTVFLLLIGGLSFVFFTGKVETANASAPEAGTSAATGLNVGGLAWIEPKSHVIKLGAPNVMEGARVEELYVGEGDQVQKGQAIGTFSTYTKNKASLEVAEASLALAKADLARVKAGNKQSDIASQSQLVQSMKASEDAAVKEYHRLEELQKQQLASKSQYDVAKAEMDGAIAKRKSAEQSLASIKSVRPDDVAISETKVKVAESEVAVAKANLDLSTIVAPISGTILTIYAHNGESVGDPGVLDLADLTTIDAVTEVDENDILKVAKGQQAEVRITGLDNPVKGTVREIGGQIKRNSLLDSADPSRMLDTRVLEVRIELNKDQNAVVSRLINKKARAVIFTAPE